MKFRKGFTLVELLIVMAIIAALLAIFVPIAGGAMKKARATRIGVIMRNAEQGAVQYILSYLPDDAASVSTDFLVDKGFLRETGLGTHLIVQATITQTEYEVGVKYDHGSPDQDLIDLIESTLKQAYPAISKTDQTITIVSTGSRFW